MRTLTTSLVAIFVMAIVFGVAAVGTADLFRHSNEETKGNITDLFPTDSKFVMSDQNGNRLDFEMGDQAKVYIDDVTASLENLTIGDRVRVVYIIDETVWYALEVYCTRIDMPRPPQ